MEMTFNAAYLTKGAIARAAEALLAEYGERFCRPAAPIPVEEMLERQLGLTLEFCDLPARCGVRDALGATWVDSRLVSIDQSLDPDEYPDRLGRYRFTLAHEIGHWRLHIPAIRLARENGTRAGEKNGEPTILCRSSLKPRMEWQADCFAGCLLMPERLVRQAWIEATGSAPTLDLSEEKNGLRAVTEPGTGWVPAVEIARVLADVFEVSGQAMEIRLEELALIMLE